MSKSTMVGVDSDRDEERAFRISAPRIADEHALEIALLEREAAQRVAARPGQEKL